MMWLNIQIELARTFLQRIFLMWVTRAEKHSKIVSTRDGQTYVNFPQDEFTETALKDYTISYLTFPYYVLPLYMLETNSPSNQ